MFSEASAYICRGKRLVMEIEYKYGGVNYKELFSEKDGRFPTCFYDLTTSLHI